MYFYSVLEALGYLEPVSWQVLRPFRLHGIHSFPSAYLNRTWDVSQFLLRFI